MLDAIFARVKELMLSPNAAWETIDTEEADVATLYKTYIIPLALITPLAMFLGRTIVSTGWYRVGIVSGLTYFIVTAAIALAAVYVFALIVDFLAPYFGAEKNFGQAFKLSAYVPTAVWIAGAANLLALRALSPLVALVGLAGGIYALYHLFIALPKMMKPPEDKATVYTLASIGCALVLGLVVSLATLPLLGASSLLGSSNSVSRRPANELERRLTEHAERMEDALERGDISDLLTSSMSILGGDGEAIIVQEDALRDLAPNRIAGLDRRSLEVESLAIPIRARVVTAEYGEAGGDRQVTFTITNSAAVNAMLGYAGFGSTRDVTTDDGYERVRRDGDTIISEEWNETTNSGHYGRALASSFVINAEGTGVRMRDLRRAVEEFSERDLRRLPQEEREEEE